MVIQVVSHAKHDIHTFADDTEFYIALVSIHCTTSCLKLHLFSQINDAHCALKSVFETLEYETVSLKIRPTVKRVPQSKTIHFSARMAEEPFYHYYY